MSQPNPADDTYYQGDGRSSRFSDSDRGPNEGPGRGVRGSGGFSRRPFGNSRPTPGNADFSNSRFAGQNDRFSETDDDYYDRGGGREPPQDEYSDTWPNDDKSDDYQDQYEGNEDNYDDYQDGSNYGPSRNNRFQGRGRGNDNRIRRGSYVRGGSPSSWRGMRGKDMPRRFRGRGPRRGM